MKKSQNLNYWALIATVLLILFGSSISTIDDKLSQIPVVLSPRSGYIRKIKPWVGNNGKYSTTITINLTAGGTKSTVGESSFQSE